VKAEDIPVYNGEVYKNYPEGDKGPGGHILTGPIAIAEAEPGDVLEVQIQKSRTLTCHSHATASVCIVAFFPWSFHTVAIALFRSIAKR